VQVYPFLLQEKLRAELELLYRRDYVSIKGALKLLQFINEHNLSSVFNEVTKLLTVVITMPMTTAEPEHCFSTLKRIKIFLRNTVTNNELSALAMLSINKDLITEMWDFDDE
jgi:hypothetical protein